MIGKLRANAKVTTAVAVSALLTVVAPASTAVGQDSAQEKVLRVPTTTSGPESLDPIKGSTQYDNRACSMIYDTLLQYKYLVRPYELEPCLVERMPEVSDDGLTWNFRLKEGIYFHDNACFPGGEGRELVAEDVIYSFKRFADPAYTYENWWLVDGVIKGFNQYKDAQAAAVDAGGAFDYDAPVEGMRLDPNDKYAFTIELNVADQQFAWKLPMFQFGIVPREAVEHYGEQFPANPVGTGPFVLREPGDWRRGADLTVYRNPEYRDDYFPEEGAAEAGFADAVGKKLPFVDKVEMTFFVEDQPLWLEFKAGNNDFSTTPDVGYDEVISRRTKELKRSWQRKGVTYHPVPLLDFIFRAFNMEDPLVGGYEPEKVALRRAIHACIDYDEMNETYYNGVCVVYDGMIPPGLDGFPSEGRIEGAVRGPDYDKARELLKEAGYTIGADGKVTDLPVIDFWTSTGAQSQKMTELVQRNLAVVGIELNPRYVNFSVLIETVNKKKAPFFSFAWGSDYPDAENNLALFYGPNESPGSNHFNYKNAEFDDMYRQIKTMPPSPERTAMYERMRDMVVADQPYSGSLARVRHYLAWPWLKNFKPAETFWNWNKYLDVEMDHPDRP